MFPLQLVNCSWMSLYIPKLDATCVLTAKEIHPEVVLHIKQAYCSMESCVADCFRLLPSCNLIKYSPFAKVCNLYYENATGHILQPIDQIGQSMHLLLHSCHEDISSIPAGIIVQSVYDMDNSASIHTPSTHKNCDFLRLPFVENFHAQRIHLIVTSSLKRCIAFCEAPTHTSCNSVLFSAQEGTCLLLSRDRNLPLLGGIIPTLQTSALFFIILRCYDDFDFPHAYSIPKFEEIAPAVYSIFNRTVSLYPVHFYATKAGIRIGLWETVNETYCIMICIDKLLADYCDGYFFSYDEKTCLTFSIRKKYALRNSPLNRRIIHFSDDRENERADNDQPELHVLPILDEVCQVELYKPLFLTGWSVIIEIRNIATLQECLTNCAAVMRTLKCSAIYFLHKSCFLLERMTHMQNYFTRERASVFAELLFCEPNI
ncbi:hypothetical protein T07_2526 [Trichinella nelsoni]|uniref:Apple domain-containing protein n=1 Tax=Trichinella nelsoni TaxID=6336 RepID=A0A0V0RF35_9BILA|nr:hypothetical protein T07_2526 [Trichinella nelsoni]